MDKSYKHWKTLQKRKQEKIEREYSELCDVLDLFNNSWFGLYDVVMKTISTEVENATRCFD